MDDHKQETSFTPGPWEWRQVEGHGGFALYGKDGVRVHTDGSAYGEYIPDIDVTGPDARLIAAAPELLEALQDLYRAEYEQADAGLLVEAMEKAREAIRKATEQP